MFLQLNKKLQPRKSAKARLSQMSGFATKNKRVLLITGVTLLSAATIIGLVAGLATSAISMQENNPNSGGGMVEQPNNPNGNNPNPQTPGQGTGPNNGEVLPPPAPGPDGNDQNVSPDGNGGILPPNPDGEQQNQDQVPPGNDNQPDVNPPESDQNNGMVPPNGEEQNNMTPPGENENTTPPQPEPEQPLAMASYYRGQRPDEFLVWVPLNNTIYKYYQFQTQQHSKMQEYVDKVIRLHLGIDSIFNKLNSGQTKFQDLFRFGSQYNGVDVAYQSVNYLGSRITLQLTPKAGFAWDVKTKDTKPKTISVFITMRPVLDKVDVPGFNENEIREMNRPKPPVTNNPSFQLQSKRHLDGDGSNPEVLQLVWNWEYVRQFSFFLQLYNGPSAWLFGDRNVAFNEFLKNTIGIEQLISSLTTSNANKSPKGGFKFRDQYENVSFQYVDRSADLGSVSFRVTVKPLANAGWANDQFGKGNEAITMRVRLTGLF